MINREYMEKYQCCQFIVLFLTFASIHLQKNIQMTSCQHCDKQFEPSEIFTKYFEAMKIFTVIYNDNLSLLLFVCMPTFRVYTWKGISDQIKNSLCVGYFRVLVKFLPNYILTYILKIIHIPSLRSTIFFQIQIYSSYISRIF